MTPILFVRADRIALASAFVTTEQTRYYLGGVNVARHGPGVHLCATDGIKLALFSDQGFAPARSVIVKLTGEAIKACLPRKGDRECLWFAMAANGQAQVVQIRYACDPCFQTAEVLWRGFVEVIDGTFPQYARIIPREVTNEHAAFDACHLDAFKPVAKPTSVRHAAVVRVHYNGAAPMLVTIDGRTDFVGVLMPCKTSAESPTRLVGWMLDYVADAVIEAAREEQYRRLAA